jgi:MFS family permease
MTLSKRHFMMAWLVIMVSNFFLLYQFIIQSSISAMIDDLMSDFDLDITKIAMLSSSYFWSYVIFQIPAGLLIDRIGPRKVMIGSVALCTASVFAFAAAQTGEVAQWARFFMGISCSPAMAACLYLAARWFPKHLFPLVVGVIEMLGMIGGALGEAFLAQAVESMGWRYSYYVFAILCAVLLVLTIFAIHDKPKHVSFEGAPERVKGKVWKSFITLLKNPQVWLIALYGGMVFAVLNGFAALWAIPFLTHQYHMNHLDAVQLGALAFVGASIGAVFTGFLCTRMSVRLLLFIQAMGCTLSMGAIIYTPFLVSPQLLPILLFLSGLFCASYILSFTLVRSLSPIETEGAAMGFTNMISIVFGSIIFQPLTAYIIDFIHGGGGRIQDISQVTTGEFQLALSPFMIALVASVIIVFFIKTPPKTAMK